MTKEAQKPAGLALLREPFPEHQISKLPKPTKAQTDTVKADYRKGVRCALCGSWHHPDVVHLDYVGHAALTDRLLDADPEWSWEPAALTEDGLPAFDKSGGLWIKLTVCGVTRLGYGHAASKPNADPGSREKEVIGDALRNAAMRFGAALDLWHKGQLHAAEEVEEAAATETTTAAEPKPSDRASPPPSNEGRVLTRAEGEAILSAIAERHDWMELDEYMAALAKGPMAFAVHHPKIKVAVAQKRAEFNQRDPIALGDVPVPTGNPFDEIPY